MRPKEFVILLFFSFSLFRFSLSCCVCILCFLCGQQNNENRTCRKMSQTKLYCNSLTTKKKPPNFYVQSLTIIIFLLFCFCITTTWQKKTLLDFFLFIFLLSPPRRSKTHTKKTEQHNHTFTHLFCGHVFSFFFFSFLDTQNAKKKHTKN